MIDRPRPTIAKTLIFTILALIAFAANSVLCRLALGGNTIDAPGFTVVRLLSGALVLFVILKITNMNRKIVPAKGSWFASIMLFLYAITFSFSYITLDTGTGALILYGAIQFTMILLSVISGNRLHISEWAGTLIVFTGFVYLVLPGVTTPTASGFLFMAVAGIAWGVYTLMGKASRNPLVDTAYNFFRVVPLVIILVIVTLKNANYSSEGILLAVFSGGITSGIGYTIWYMALGGLSATQAAVLQLLVPPMASLGGVIFVAEPITPRLVVSSVIILGGILMVVLGRYYFVQLRPDSNA